MNSAEQPENRTSFGLRDLPEEASVSDDADPTAVYDGREPFLLLVLSLVVLFAFGGVVWMAYSQGIARGRTEVVKIFEQRAPLDEGDTPATKNADLKVDTALSVSERVPIRPVGNAPQSRPSISPNELPVPTAQAELPFFATASIQIGAFKSRNEAERVWEEYSQRPDLKGYRPSYEVVDLGGRGTWHRLQIGGFKDKQTALASCARLKDEGINCFVVNGARD